jgi:hypothetical protein
MLWTIWPRLRVSDMFVKQERHSVYVSCHLSLIRWVGVVAMNFKKLKN